MDVPSKLAVVALFSCTASFAAAQTTAPVDYLALVHQLHNTLYKLNMGVDFVTLETADFSEYKLLVVPALYVADDALLTRISEYVKNGGHVLMTFKSGFADENSMVRHVRALGPLREAAGFNYQEFSNLEEPLSLKAGVFDDVRDRTVNYWAEFLMLEHATPVALYDDAHLARWPAITENKFGKGTLLYEGTWLSDDLQRAMLLKALDESGIADVGSELPAPVRMKSGVNGKGKTIHYFLNYSSDAQHFNYTQRSGVDLLTGKSIALSQSVELAPWDLAIIEEK